MEHQGLAGGIVSPETTDDAALNAIADERADGPFVPEVVYLGDLSDAFMADLDEAARNYCPPNASTPPRDVIAEARALIEPLTGHSKGPWRWLRDIGGWFLTPDILSVDGARGTLGGDRRDHANARLIAAAPEMRDTIAALLGHIDAQAQREAEKDARIAALQADLRLAMTEWRETNADLKAARAALEARP